ncbi:MAG: hypothetical protein HUU50_09080 [Candidatus Brocadiae bacterium]|nr:hypothetical protein [Candidatus Brocadiia bacterium]
MDYLNKLAKTWNEWRDDIIDPIGDYISLAYNSLTDALIEGFPHGFKQNGYEKLQNPDIDFFINLKALNRGLDVYLKDTIPLDKNNPKSNNFINVYDGELEVDEKRNVIILKVKDGRIGFDASKVRGGFMILSATIEIAPRIIENDKLEVYAKIVYLDVKNVPSYFDEAIAQGLDSFLEKQGSIASKDIGDIIKTRIPIMNRKESLEPKIEKVALFVKNEGIMIQATYKML